MWHDAAVSEARVRPALEDAISANPISGGAILVSWVVVAEWVTPDAEHELAMTHSEDMTPWQRRGMLTEACEEEGWA